MALPTDYFVDPDAGDDGTGTGAIGAPWKTTQHALDTITRDAANGDQVNIKAGADDVLAATLDFSTYGTPTEAAPLLFRGYTSAVGDGGQGGLDGDGSPCISEAALDYVYLADMHCHNCGAGPIVDLDRYCEIWNCEFDGSTGDGLTLTVQAGVYGCYLHNIGGLGIDVVSNSRVVGNYLLDGTNTFNAAIETAAGTEVGLNIISMGATAGEGIRVVGDTNSIYQNSVLSAGGSGKGIYLPSGYSADIIISNLVEGFSDSGVGIDYSSGIAPLRVARNAVYGCSTAYHATGSEIMPFDGAGDDNETLSASPFAKSGANTFANRFSYYRPLNVGNVWRGAWPSGCGIHKGAVGYGGTFMPRPTQIGL